MLDLRNEDQKSNKGVLIVKVFVTLGQNVPVHLMNVNSFNHAEDGNQET